MVGQGGSIHGIRALVITFGLLLFVLARYCSVPSILKLQIVCYNSLGNIHMHLIGFASLLVLRVVLPSLAGACGKALGLGLSGFFR